MKRIDELRQARDKVFQTPPIEWIEEMLSQFRESLEVNTNDSALVLHNLLGPVKLEAKYPDIGKPYYLTYTSINALAITEPPPNYKSTDNGSTSFQWWARKERIRTFAEISFQIEFHQVGKPPLNQEIAVTALHQKQLGSPLEQLLVDSVGIQIFG